MRYIHNRETVISALKAGDAAFIVDTRDSMAMRLDELPKVGGCISETPEAVYHVFADGQPWMWPLNARCKYVYLVSKEGRIHLLDRDRRPLTMAELRRQVGKL